MSLHAVNCPWRVMRCDCGVTGNRSAARDAREDGEQGDNAWICQCGDMTVVPRLQRCPKCGKRERDRA